MVLITHQDANADGGENFPSLNLKRRLEPLYNPMSKLFGCRRCRKVFCQNGKFITA